LGRFAGWIAAIVIISAIIGLIWAALPETVPNLPSVPGIDLIETAIASQPRLAAYLITSVIVLLILTCLITSLVSNARFHGTLGEKFLLRPKKPDRRVTEKSDLSDDPLAEEHSSST
jgi:hypothetical protein